MPSVKEGFKKAIKYIYDPSIGHLRRLRLELHFSSPSADRTKELLDLSMNDSRTDTMFAAKQKINTMLSMLTDLREAEPFGCSEWKTDCVADHISEHILNALKAYTKQDRARSSFLLDACVPTMAKAKEVGWADCQLLTNVLKQFKNEGPLVQRLTELLPATIKQNPNKAFALFSIITRAKCVNPRNLLTVKDGSPLKPLSAEIDGTRVSVAFVKDIPVFCLSDETKILGVYPTRNKYRDGVSQNDLDALKEHVQTVVMPNVVIPTLSERLDERIAEVSQVRPLVGKLWKKETKSKLLLSYKRQRFDRAPFSW